VTHFSIQLVTFSDILLDTVCTTADIRTLVIFVLINMQTYFICRFFCRPFPRNFNIYCIYVPKS